MKEFAVGYKSPVLGREHISCVVHDIEAIGTDFKGMGRIPRVGPNPAECHHMVARGTCRRLVILFPVH